MKHCAFITGASSGLGAAFTTLIAKDFKKLVLIGRNQEKLTALRTQIQSQCNTEVHVVEADLSAVSGASGLISRGLKASGASDLDLLVNCAGFAATGRVENIPLEAVERCLRVNFLAPVELIQQALPIMRRQRESAIVNVTSGVAHRALPFYFPYCSAKSALNAFSESLRVELFESNIHLLLFSPGPIASAFQTMEENYGGRHWAGISTHAATPQWVAQQMLLALQKKKRFVLLGQKARIARHLNYWSTSLMDYLLLRAFRPAKA